MDPLINNIDFRTCKQFNQCYSCAKLGNGKLEGTSEECIGEYTKYRFKLLEDQETGEKVPRIVNEVYATILIDHSMPKQTRIVRAAHLRVRQTNGRRFVKSKLLSLSVSFVYGNIVRRRVGCDLPHRKKQWRVEVR